MDHKAGDFATTNIPNWWTMHIASHGSLYVHSRGMSGVPGYDRWWGIVDAEYGAPWGNAPNSTQGNRSVGKVVQERIFHCIE